MIQHLRGNMNRNSIKRLGLFVSIVLVLAAMACSDEPAAVATNTTPTTQPATSPTVEPEPVETAAPAEPEATPTEEAAATPEATAEPEATATSEPEPTEAPDVTATPVTPAPSPIPTTEPVVTETVTPAPTATSTPEAVAEEVALEITSPQEGIEVEWGAVRVSGATRPDAVVAVNGTVAEVQADGSFTLGVSLEEGPNTIEIVATDIENNTESEQLVVFYTPPAEGLPLTLFSPADGIEVNTPDVEVMGAARPDTVVSVNGELVDTNALGIFSASVVLEEGPNIIEVAATDIDNNTRFEPVVVFYTP